MTRLPLDFPPLRALGESRAGGLLDAIRAEHGILSGHAEGCLVEACVALLSDLTRPESQAVWLRWLAERLGVPVPVVGCPRWERSGGTSPGWCAYTLGTPDGIGTPGLSRWFRFGSPLIFEFPTTVNCPALPDPDSADAPIRALVLAILTVGGAR